MEKFQIKKSVIKNFKISRNGVDLKKKQPLDHKKYFEFKKANDVLTKYKNEDNKADRASAQLAEFINKFRKENKPLSDKEFIINAEYFDKKLTVSGKKQEIFAGKGKWEQEDTTGTGKWKYKNTDSDWKLGFFDEEGNFHEQKKGTWNSSPIKVIVKGTSIKNAHDLMKEKIKQLIIDRRQELKKPNEEFVVKESFNIPVINENVTREKVFGTYLKPNTYLDLLEKKSIGDVFKSKVPKDNQTDKFVGVELEFFGKIEKSDLGLALFKAGLKNHVNLKSDGSIRVEKDGEKAHELVILMKESEVRDVMKKVCDILDKMGAKVNKSCGFHVHLDMRNRDHKLSYNNLVAAQDVLYKMLPVSRRNTKYCKRNLNRDFDQGLRDQNPEGNRYWGINPHAYGQHKTLEVRAHSGTTQYDKIVNWIELLIQLTEKREKLDNGIRSVTVLENEFNLKPETVEYIKARIQHFEGSNNKNEEAA